MTDQALPEACGAPAPLVVRAAFAVPHAACDEAPLHGGSHVTRFVPSSYSFPPLVVTWRKADNYAGEEWRVTT